MLETDQVDGAINSALVTAIESAFTTLFNPVSFNNDFELVTYSKLEEQALSTFAWPAENVRVMDQIARIVRRRPRFQGRS